MNRGKVLHASFHFESRLSIALNAERVASIRPNGTFVDAQKENKRKEGRRRAVEKKIPEREVLPIKLSSTRKPRAQHHNSLLRRPAACNVTTVDNFQPCKASNSAVYDACLIACNGRFSKVVSRWLGKYTTRSRPARQQK